MTWSDADSDDLDRRTRAMRKPDPTVRPTPPNRGVNTFNYAGIPRGELTREEQRRRKAVERAMHRRAQREGDN